MTEMPDSSPREDVGPREPLSEVELAALGRAGRVVSRIPDPRATQARKDRAGELFQPTVGAVPSWVAAHPSEGGELRALATQLRDRALRAPTRSNLILALGVLNEMARTEAGAAIVARAVDSAVLADLAGRSKGGKKR